MPGNKPRLLIIDDQPKSVAPLIDRLGDEEIETIVALDGPDGLAKAVAGRPDLILLDMQMAGANGLEVCRALKEDVRTTGIPVIFLSASTTIDDKLKAFSLGVVDYISKPFSEDEAMARIFIHLNSKQRIDRLEAMVAQAALDRVGGQAFPDELLFSQALAALEKRLSAPQGLVALARELGTNERKLTEIFRQRVGLTVFEYFSEMRLETARHLLERSGMRVQAIAGHVGYQNAGDFTRAYRRRYGLSPREHRQTTPGGSEVTG